MFRERWPLSGLGGCWRTSRSSTRFVACTFRAQSAASSLHVAHAHAIEAADTPGYLHVRSTEKRGCKTRFLECAELLVPSPIRASTISPAALFRLLDSESRTLLLDESTQSSPPKSDREELRFLRLRVVRRGSPVPPARSSLFAAARALGSAATALGARVYSPDVLGAVRGRSDQ
jgi:hypothetical protein